MTYCRWARPQGGGTYRPGLQEPTLPRGLRLHPVTTGGGGPLMGPVPLFLPPARPVAKCACPADASRKLSTISSHPPEEAEREGKRARMTAAGPLGGGGTPAFLGTPRAVLPAVPESLHEMLTGPAGGPAGAARLPGVRTNP